ncbi:40S ribosomal protein S29 [Pelomyxa schiedti]|nr:40S ribosomal protein S29 [Pelomyxa schiedti]
MSTPPADRSLVVPGTSLVSWQARKPEAHSAAQEALESVIGIPPYAARPLADDIKAVVMCPPDIDILSWQYEQLRVTIIQLNHLVVTLGNVCTATSCPQMKADQWQFYCAAHGSAPKDCCAMDYALHNLDSATEILCNRTNYPDREKIPDTIHLKAIARRIYRIFGHAFYHHFEIFQTFERETRLCGRFTALCQMYELITPASYIIPINKLSF